MANKPKTTKPPLPRKSSQVEASATRNQAMPGDIGPMLHPDALGPVSAEAVLQEQREERLGLTADPKKDGIPVALQTQNRKPLTPEQKAMVAAAIAKAPAVEVKQRDLRAAQAEDRKARDVAKRAAKKEKAEAVKAGATTTMPLEGRAALKLLSTKADEAVKNGDVKVKKIATGVTTVKANGSKKPTTAAEVDAKHRARALKAKAKKPAGNSKPKAATRPDGLREGSGMATLADTVCRKAGATHKELCEAVGWAQCLPMMKKAVERAGIKLRSEKDGVETRYFGTAKK